MKKRIIKLVVLLMIIIFLPYSITMLLIGTDFVKHTKENVEYQIQYETDEGRENINFENYIIGVVAATIPPDYELEALKAQAVIVRTYALKVISTLQANGYENEFTVDELGLDFYSMKDMESKWGSDNYKDYLSNIKKAVYATTDEILTYKNQLIEPLFHRVSVGKTRSAKNAFGENRPYLVEVESLDDVTSNDYMKITELNVTDVLEKLSSYYKNINIDESQFFDKVKVKDRDDLGYVLKIDIGTYETTGEEFAKVFGLNSSNFYIEKYGDKVRFITKGYGHGLGFSQFGGNKLAEKGSNYKKILGIYYKDTKVVIK
ncbi:stage II sporulation protein D [Anaeromicropila herbilytica]|uniref:Stage II sporulation protein D n=1 Tax=Anaeromicropila herbilytica TaxID=2785025 RepID=A0A7R7IF65_9FIRM|nr:stage II sporulation protein D [Anaeromicropila herbilytica]BCN32854.1 stage II sporulation protein D [Anaeromicropila herbilytica]